MHDAGDALEVLAASECRLVLSGHKHVPHAWRLEDLFVVNAGTVSTLRTRGKGRPCYNVVEVHDDRVDVHRAYPFHERDRILEFSLTTLDHRKWPGHDGSSAGRRRALPAGRGGRDRGRRRRRGGAAARRHGEAARRAVRGRLRRGAARARRGRRTRRRWRVCWPRFGADLVVDLSDEPVVTQRRAAAAGCGGARTPASPTAPAGCCWSRSGGRRTRCRRSPSPAPASGSARRRSPGIWRGWRGDLVAPGEVVVVAMGRGGPAAPELVEPGDGRPARRCSRGRGPAQHAASDFLEDALLAGVTAIGCRRCGGGPGRRRRPLDGRRGRRAGGRPPPGADDVRGLRRVRCRR